MRIKLRDYQQECVDLINAKGREGRHLVAMATGLGKTAIFTSIDRTGRTLILSHRDELVHQPERYYTDCSFGVEKAEEHANGEDVVSASVQSLSMDSRLSRYAADAFHTIIIDEAHHAAAPTYKKILKHFSGAKQVLGVTATPKRGDDVRLTDVFDDILFARDLRWGIRNSWLSSIRCERVVAPFELHSIGKTAGDFNPGELEAAIGGETLAVAAKAYVERCHERRRHTLIYCLSIRECEALCGIIRGLMPEGEQEAVRVLTGKTPDDERKAILAGFQDGSIRCIVNCMVLTEGTDLPVCDTVINMRPTCNTTLYQQMVGRGTRLYNGKDYCLVIDIVPSDERKIRNLCTAPTLFGIDPSMLPKKVSERFKEDEDLLELCDEITGTITAGTDMARQMELSVVLEEALIQGQTDIIMGGDGEEHSYKGAAERMQAAIDQKLGESGLDFGRLYVTAMPDENHRFVIRPSWEEAIYISTPDVMGNVTVDFHVSMNVKTTGSCGKQHYIANLPFTDAVRLAKEYCMLSPEYGRYSWDSVRRKEWMASPATPGQKRKLEKCFKKFGFEKEGLDALNKLEASTMIDQKMDMDQKAAFVKGFKLSERQRQSTKDKKILKFRDRKEKEQEGIEKGRADFPAFCAMVKQAYGEVMERREAKERELQERNRQEAAEIGRGYYEMKLDPGALSGMATDKQISYIQSLVMDLARAGHLIAGHIYHDVLTRQEASRLIEVCIYLSARSPRPKNPFIYKADDILGGIRKAHRVMEKGEPGTLRLYFVQKNGEMQAGAREAEGEWETAWGGEF